MTKERTRSKKLSVPNEAAELEKAYQELHRKTEELQQAHREMEFRNRRLQAQLLKAREELAAILDSVSDALLVTDLEGQIVELNPEAGEFLKIERMQAAGRHFRSLLHSTQLEKGIGQALDDLSGDSSFEFEDRRLNPHRVYQANTSPLLGSSGNPRGLVVLIRDISRLRELDRMKSEFLSTAAHKLRAPMTSIVGFSEILLTRPNLPERRKKRYLQLIHDASNQLSELVDDLLDVSRIESEQSPSLELKQVRIEELLRNEAEGFEAFQQSHHFKLLLPEALPPVVCDPVRIRQVIRHLLSNAIKYSPGGGEIRATVTASDGLMRVLISDQGIGMSPDQVRQAFEKFYRADSSNTAVEGTGLGLPIAKSILGFHNGEIAIESERKKGTAVEFTLPLEMKRQQTFQFPKETVESCR